MDDLTLTPLPHREVTRPRLARALVDIGWAEDLQDGERLAHSLFPDLPGEIVLED